MSVVQVNSRLYELPSDVESQKTGWITPSTTEPTYAALKVGLCQQHTVVVRVTVNPFRLRQHRGHVFFSVAVCYIRCCSSLTSEHEVLVKQRTAEALQVFFPQICCDLDESGCFRDETSQLVGETPRSCQEQALLASNYLITSISKGDQTGTQENEDADIARKIVSKISINTGPNKRRVRPLQEVWTGVPHRQNGQSYAEFIGIFETTFQALLRYEIRATCEYVAACVRLAAPHLPRIHCQPESVDVCCNGARRQETEKWRLRAQTANLIVDGLIAAWGPKALTLYDILATDKSWFRPMRDIRGEHRSRITAEVISQLQDEPEPKTESSYVFNPESEVAKLLSLPPETTRGLLLSRPISSVQFIPPLLYAMGGQVPKVLIDRATTPQKRLGEKGEIRELAPGEAGLDRNLASLLSNKSRLQQSLDRLVSCSVVGQEESMNGLTSYVCYCDSTRVAFGQDTCYWMHRAFELLCYVFPRSEVIDPSFRSVGQILIGFLRHLLQIFAQIGLKLPCTRSAMETLLAASKFGNLSCRQGILTTAALLQATPEIEIEAGRAQEQSVVSRLNGRISDSDNVLCSILGTLQENATVQSPRSHALSGHLYLSRANNRIYQFDFINAQKELCKWHPLSSTFSEEEFDVLWNQTYCRARILRGLGLFFEAKYCLENCLRTFGLGQSKRQLIESSLADLYCELDYLQRKTRQISEDFIASKTSYLEEAEEMIRPEIERARLQGKRSRGVRRLLLSQVEIEIRRDRLKEAECLVNEVLDQYRDLAEPDIVDRLGHVRALISLARITPLTTAAERWLHVLDQNKRYNPFEEDVFTSGLIYLFLASTHFKTGNLTDAMTDLSRAKDILRTQKPQFLIPGVGTYLFDFIRMELSGLFRKRSRQRQKTASA